ncbi:hypothetical protein DRB06_11445 [Actinomyces sp. Z5]|uniref:hypothetical protein n=1 Tax=Actinomyces sp. Z5 TaxID=2250216 RepID=UPI000DCB6513|nr:hypothetical protein [Actinomyces sp. Z5]RAX19742.1 hypothetical protein DRB06_11445 [Actinomyces sp. Z5]
MAVYETDDGEPRYGKRLSPEELAAYLREQGMEPPIGTGGDRPAADAQIPASANDPYRRSPIEAGGPVPTRWGAGTSARGSARPAHRWRTFGVGVVLMLVIAPLLLLTGALTVLGGSLTRSATLGEDGVVYLESGTPAGLYGTFATAVTGCTVTDPDGAAVALDAPEAGVPYATFTPARSGAYTVTCPAGTAGLVVGPPMNLDRVPLAAALILGAGAVGLSGLIVTVVGVVRARR